MSLQPGARAKIVTVLLAVLAASPVVSVALWSIHRTIVEWSDPCAKWGHAPGDEPQAQIAVVIGPNDPCRVKTVHDRAKTDTAIIAVLVPGGLLTAAMLAVAGAALSRRRVMLAGAIGLLAETIFVFTIAPLTLVVGLSFLLLARRVQPSS